MTNSNACGYLTLPTAANDPIEAAPCVVGA